MILKNFVIAHKQFNLKLPENYEILQVGNGKELNSYRDNTGINIANKNQNYCELTGIYWIWKNINNCDYIGISHYRRYFKKNLFSKKIINREDALKLLNKYDVIVPKKEIYKESVRDQYCLSSGFMKDLVLLEDVINKKYPQYIDSFREVMQSNQISQYNMIICNKKIFNEYCEWLFNILFELEPQINLDKYNDYQKRIYGFMSERLLNVWILHNKLKVKELHVLNTEITLSEKIKLFCRRIKNYLISILN